MDALFLFPTARLLTLVAECSTIINGNWFPFLVEEACMKMLPVVLFILLVLAVTLVFNSTFSDWVWMPDLPAWGNIVVTILVAALVCWFLVRILSNAVQNSRTAAWLGLGLLFLAAQVFACLLLVTRLDAYFPFAFSEIPLLAPYFVTSGSLVVAAFLLYRGTKPDRQKPLSEVAVQEPVAQADFAKVGLVTLGILLLAAAFVTWYWFIAWDTTDDALEYIWLAIPLIAVLLSGMVFSLLKPRQGLLTALYLLLVPAVLVMVTWMGVAVDFRAQTDAHAARVTRALDAYQARTGAYPQELASLSPRDLFLLPVPFIIYGQDWCYEGGEDGYRLGYVDRSHWSDPNLFGHLYQASGSHAGASDLCADEIRRIQERDPGYYGLNGN